MKILLALGANLPSVWGNPAETLSFSISRLSERIGRNVEFVQFYVAPAFPAGSGPDFINTVIGLNCDESPENLLEICHKIEKEARRKRDNRWGPRTLDIDLLAVDQQIRPDIDTYNEWRTLPRGEQLNRAPKELILPHPRLHERAFVLVPMADIAPDWIHPVLGQTVLQMRDALPADERDAIKRYVGP
ncbi:MAG: 2-amino-4-hydroxy-6-hydroxymethyldihydropteridine diphosphokinase [Pseudomonadota bacterium]